MRSKVVLKTETLDAVADRGYFNSPEILACHEAGITVTLPKPQTSNAKAGTDASVTRTLSICRKMTPIAAQLGSATLSLPNEEDGKMLRRYWTTACKIVRSNPNARQDQSGGLQWEHEHLLEAVPQRLDANPEAMRQRRETIEHPFGR
ncbi:hypothetical protein H8B02_42355 [Bradyrhizobium sp. Pear77]|nr:hypothetical protein [Bradyrhizobium altum]MCC8967657.1 hypothetical protein [Bradyrhizobium oropedii]